MKTLGVSTNPFGLKDIKKRKGGGSKARLARNAWHFRGKRSNSSSRSVPSALRSLNKSLVTSSVVLRRIPYPLLEFSPLLLKMSGTGLFFPFPDRQKNKALSSHSPTTRRCCYCSQLELVPPNFPLQAALIVEILFPHDSCYVIFQMTRVVCTASASDRLRSFPSQLFRPLAAE